MAERPITIHSVCVTTPDEHVHVKVGDQVRWKADHAEVFILHIPGGFFQGHPEDFLIFVLAGIWTANYTVAGKVGTVLTNYIYSLDGKNCLIETADGPPDIIIDSTLVKPKPKKAVSKKAAPKKKK